MNDLLIMLLCRYVLLGEEIDDEQRAEVQAVVDASTFNPFERVGFYGFLSSNGLPITYDDGPEDIEMSYDDSSRRQYLEQYAMAQAQLTAGTKIGSDTHKTIDMFGTLKVMTYDEFIALIIRYWAAYKTLWDNRVSVE
jgi:hypothetical protein